MNKKAMPLTAVNDIAIINFRRRDRARERRFSSERTNHTRFNG